MLFNPKPLSFVNSQVMVVLKSIIIKQWSHLIPIFLVHTECDVQEGDGICGPVGAWCGRQGVGGCNAVLDKSLK